jgi:protein gp37
MRDKTAIEWTDSTWNPVTGCSAVSAGCDNCYAKTLAETRLESTYLARLPVVDSHPNQGDPFAVRLWQERLTQPERWRAPRMIFVNSMSDLFHKDIPDAYVRRIFDVMVKADWHIYQVLTKRPGRALRFFRKYPRLFPSGLPEHIWLGVSVEDERVAYRIPQLVQVPAAVRFLSCEPLIGPLQPSLEGIHWVIVGGESGPNRRPMQEDWATQIRDLCRDQSVPFFFKQWGGHTPKAGGRSLQGKTWNQYPNHLRRRRIRNPGTRIRLASG